MRCLTYLLLLLSFLGKAQLKDFSTTERNKIAPYYKYSAYAFIDAVRESGVGFEYQPFRKIDLDFSLYNLHQNSAFKSNILQWDYYDLHGFGISLKPKFFVGKHNHFYVGVNLGYETVNHDKIWVTYQPSSDIRFMHFEEAKGSIYNIGATIGNKIYIKRLLIEPFLGAGIGIQNITTTVYKENGFLFYPYTFTYPHSYKPEHHYFQCNFGVKLGFLFKKQNDMDTTSFAQLKPWYVTKEKEFNEYFKTIPTSIIKASPNLSGAYDMYLHLNYKIGFYYHKYFNDSTRLYKKIDRLFLIIDKRIANYQSVRQKMNNVYIPKTNALISYFKTIDLKSENANEYSKKAYFEHLKLAKKITIYYNRNSFDTTYFFKKVDALYNHINDLILKSKP